MLELVFSWYLASSCWCLALSCARPQSVEGELYPKLMTVIRSYCASCRLRPLLLHYLSSGGRSSTTTSTSIVHLYKNLFEQKVDPLRTQGRWPRACCALGPAGSSSRYVIVRLVRFPLRMDLWFSDCCLFNGTQLDPFGQVLCVVEPLYLLSASFA